MNPTIIKLLLLLILIPQFFTAQVPYNQTHFRAPLNIPLILAGNFAELRSNHFHTGLDIKTNHKEGYRVYAIDSGYVSRINISHWGYGKAIYVTHPNGYTSVYAHLRNFPKKIEQYLRKKQFEKETETIDINLSPEELPVSRGEIIAFSGNSGSSSAPHLHFEIRETESENPVNPLLFHFDIPDNVTPSIFNIKVYPINGTVNKTQKERVFATVGTGKNYKLKDNPTILLNGDIGFGIHTIDRLNGANNKCGIYTIELKVDNQTIFKQKMEKLDFATNRYINAHKDYYEYHKRRRSFHKSFKTDNNDLAIYENLVNNGIYTFNDDAVHSVRYIVTDTYGNTSVLNFNVKSTSQHFPTQQKITNAKALAPFTFEKEDFKANMEAKTLYQDENITYKKEKTLYSSAPLHTFGNSQIPLHKRFVLQIKTQGIAPKDTSKAIVVKISDDKRKAFARGGQFQNGWVTAKVKELGKYTVKLDTVAPVVTPVNIYNGKNIGKQSTIQFKISDNLSGIKSYKIYIDKQFKLANYFPRKNLLKLTFDEYNKIPKGKHHIKVVVTDERNNATVKDFDVIR